MIALVGDRDDSIAAHRAIPVALGDVAFEWVATDAGADLSRFSGVWCVPGSPYRSEAGALDAIRYARENAVPYLGTCGGFQHAVIEHARNVLGWTDAAHAETDPDAARIVIAPLSCALVETSADIRLVPDSLLARAYGSTRIREGYRCRYGIDRDIEDAFRTGPLRACAYDEEGEIRAVELGAHPFFVATLFQPERAALEGRATPLIDAFVASARARSR